MAQHFTSAVTVHELAGKACLSVYHFLRSYRKRYHETPRQYLIRRRLEFAKNLLETTELSITEICLESGFSSLGTFSTLFRRRTGFSPSDYRARRREMARDPRRFIPGCLLLGPKGSNFQEAFGPKQRQDEDYES